MKKVKRVLVKTKNNFVNYIKNIIEIINKPEMAILPGQIAFSFILSIVPILTILGYGASIFGINMDSIIKTLDDVIPGGAEILTPILAGQSLDFRLILIIIWMSYIASNGCNSIILVSNQIYGINKSNWLKRRIKAIFMTIAIITMLLFILIVPVFGNKLVDLLDFLPIYEKLKIVLNILQGPLTWIILIIFLRTFYEVAPDRVRRYSHINTGTIFTTIGWIIVTAIYKALALNMSTYNLYYGTLSNIAFVMIWLYFISFIFVIGLILNFGEERNKEVLENTGVISIPKS